MLDRADYASRVAAAHFDAKIGAFPGVHRGTITIMESTPTPSGPDVERLMVPEELLQQLHEAHQRFHQSKQELEKQMADSDYDHSEHVKQRMDDVQKIEREVEALNEKVQEILRRKA
jgi:hypothetical protein